MMVIFLVGLVSMILMRTLRKDYARYSKEEEMDDMVSDPRELWFHHADFKLLFVADADAAPLCFLSLCVDRTGIWGMSTAGSRCMATCSGRPAIRSSSPRSLALAARSFPSPSSSSSLRWWRICTQSQ